MVIFQCNFCETIKIEILLMGLNSALTNKFLSFKNYLDFNFNTLGGIPTIPNGIKIEWNHQIDSNLHAIVVLFFCFFRLINKTSNYFMNFQNREQITAICHNSKVEWTARATIQNKRKSHASLLYQWLTWWHEWMI